MIEIADLQVGDEIIVPSNSMLMYLKVLRPVKLRKRGGINQRTQKALYSGVWCSTRKVVKTYSYTWANGKIHTWNKNEYECTPLNHNIEGYRELNYKTIWLVKR